jgi:uncharacterized protein (TIGR00106 family)
VGHAIVAVSISPVGSGSPSVSRYVAAADAVLRRAADVRSELGPMFTTVEGDLHRILDLVEEMQEAVFAAGAQRVSTVLKIDERRDRPNTMAHKVEVVRALSAGFVPDDGPPSGA